MDETAPAAGDPFSTVQLRWLFLAVGLGLLGYFAYAFAVRSELFEQARHLGLAAYALALYVPILVWMAIASKDAGIDLGRFLRPMASPFWWAAPGVAVLALAFSLMSSMVLFWLLATAAPHFAHDILAHGNPIEVGTKSDSGFLVFVIFVLVAPVIEELLFRGVLLHVLTARWGVTRGLIVMSLAFALLHPNPVATFAFSLLLGSLYLRSRTLIAPMLCHMTNNFFPTLITLAVRKGGTPDDAAASAALALGTMSDVILVPLVGSLILGGVLAVVIVRTWPKPGERLPYFDDDAAPPDDAPPDDAPTLEGPPLADSGSTS